MAGVQWQDQMNANIQYASPSHNPYSYTTAPSSVYPGTLTPAYQDYGFLSSSTVPVLRPTPQRPVSQHAADTSSLHCDIQRGVGNLYLTSSLPDIGVSAMRESVLIQHSLLQEELMRLSGLQHDTAAASVQGADRESGAAAIRPSACQHQQPSVQICRPCQLRQSASTAHQQSPAQPAALQER